MSDHKQKRLSEEADAPSRGEEEALLAQQSAHPQHNTKSTFTDACVEAPTASGLSRRDALRVVGLTTAVAAGGTLLAACGDRMPSEGAIAQPASAAESPGGGKRSQASFDGNTAGFDPKDNDYHPPFSAEEYARRHRMLREAMGVKGLDCLIIYGSTSWSGTDTGQSNAVYLSSLAPFVHSYVVFPLKGDPTLFTVSAFHRHRDKQMTVIEDIRLGGFNMEKGLAQRLKELNLNKGKIGIVGAMGRYEGGDFTIPWEHGVYLTKEFPRARFETVTEWYIELRLVKSAEEVAYLDKAGAMADAATAQILLALRPGIRQCDLREIVASVVGPLGGKYPMFIVGSTQAKNPEWYSGLGYLPTRRPIQAGDMVTMDIPVSYGGYTSKNVVTFFLGDPGREYEEMFEVSGKIFDTVLKEFKPGIRGRDVAKWLNPLAEAGYTHPSMLIMGFSNYNHAPRVGMLSRARGDVAAQVGEQESDLDFVFRPGNVFRLGLSPSTLDIRKAVKLGGSTVVTKDGLRRLTSFPVTKFNVIE